MSVVHIDHKQKEPTSSLNQIPTMGNLFSKESDLEADDSIEDSGAASLSPTTASMITDEDFLFTFYRQGEEDPNPLESEKLILNAFLNEVRNAKPAPLKNWSALHHYIYYIYRHVISGKPSNCSEIFSQLIVKKLRDLIEGLMQEDLTQICIRLVTLIREFSIVTRGHFDSLRHPKASSYLMSLMSYYSAFCSSACKLAPLLPEFDFLVMERFNVNWLCLNKSMFFHYVYRSPAVRAKLPLFLKMKEDNKIVHRNLLESYTCFLEDMTLVASKWAALKLEISNLSQKRALSNPSKHLMSDWKMFEEHKKILKTNYWMIRNTQEMQLQDMSELDAHVLSLVGDTSYIADFLIDAQGNCLCEECLSAEFRTNMLPPLYDENAPEVYHLISCYLCQKPLPLETFTSHIMAKHQESSSQKPTRVYLTPHQKRLFCPQKSSRSPDPAKTEEAPPYEELFENKTVLRDSILKIVNSKTGLMSEKHNSNDENHIVNTEGIRETSKNIVKAPVFSVAEVEELKHKTPRSLWSSNMNSSFDLDTSAKNIKEPVFKVASEAPVMKTESDSLIKGASKRNDNVSPQNLSPDSKKVHVNSTVKVNNGEKLVATDSSNKKALNTNSELCQKDASQTLAGDNSNVSERSSPNTTNTCKLASEKAAFRKPQQKGLSSMDNKMIEIFKNANAQKSTSTAPKKSNLGTCHGAACAHQCKQEAETDVNKCKQEVEKLIESKKHSCQDTCDYHKESRKCDCAYCEVFGSSLPPHTHKTNETRDRLRTRLNQRKEKDGTNKLPTKVVSGTTKVNVKTSNVNGLAKMSNNTKVVLNGKVEADPRGPPRVPEVVHVVPPASNKKSVLTSAESKKLQTLNSRESRSVQKSVARATSATSELDRNANDCPPCRSLSSLSISSLNSDNIDSRDINELLNYIEGNKKVDKAALAQKKADKKARQRMKKAQIRERIEMEKQLKEEARLQEEKLKEEERLKAELLARQLENQKKLKKVHEDKIQDKQDTKKNKKKNKTKGQNFNVKEDGSPKLIEETIPAMVTIKRVAEGSDTPATVTITLKGSTPESDKLLFTLVNGYNDKEHVGMATINGENNNKTKNDTSAKEQTGSNKKDKDPQIRNAKKKKGKQTNDSVSKELRVTIALDKNNVNKKEALGKKSVKINETNKASTNHAVVKTNKEPCSKKPAIPKPVNNTRNDINIPMLRLPPGITITKIEGPPTNRNSKNGNNTSSPPHNQNSNVPVSKSGVIVVDTEKLIQQSITAANNKKNKKKNKKKRNGKLETNEGFPNKANTNNSESSMVTLKNPIFHTLQTALCNKVTENNELSVYPSNQQAAIFKNENGMVTIRSPRLQNNFENGSPLSNFLTDLKPMFGPEVSSSCIPMCQTNFTENKSFNAQEILSGLPGIEVTKVDKNSSRNDSEHKRSSQPAEVSIIPTVNGANGTDKFNFDRDDWPFESVFTPRDVLEEDMDAEERELEAFKRFCQQSIPPKRKEKVAHLNVKDIVFKKKKDVTYS